MPLKLRYWNRLGVVTIPAPFERGKGSTFILQSIKTQELWWRLPVLPERLLQEHDRIT